MSLYADKSVDIEVLDNGYLLTWEDKTKGSGHWAAVDPRLEPKTRGREVIETKAALIKRLKQLL
ncbi:hypothetical protein GTA62_14555 [Roseobacter sp. HKCCD9010]|uniref:hypothetical protein n=1 Tax=unclassified Roseobacter TaxID=196798 RepID=UPI001490E161|nr:MULTISPECIES: hypothetical protein [unclassified Roseobacter]MBF9050669.1 hypothetical protein [Rhodobacterales bacterium HKCCD4356]NNV11913.1 hypothetical protein [Roseobacter sp. HKCCD7357]NNV16926.1 hypothetical protein [Roseobacter sp. HKCCD8768]NNV26155.1 hypothetical protein [Roseobacter sp. HKCCD8192]NNV30647.1 hypothetical protein [Roseobacter sp. HKCCD9061]